MKEWLASLPPIPLYKQLLVLLLLALLTLFVYLSLKAWKRLDELELKDRFAARNEFIKTTAQILGGAFFLFGLYFTWSNLEATREKNRADLAIAQDRQATDLFTKAIGQLGSDKLEVRLGGIYSLERIARDSEKDHWPIMEVLTAYVRENAPWPPEPLAEARKKRPWAKPKEQGPSPPEQGKTEKPEEITIKPDPDIQAVLTVINRRTRTYGQGENERLDLRATDLRGAYLPRAQLEGAELQKACLDRATLFQANLRKANLNDACLKGAHLSNAHLESVALRNAHLEGADLEGAHLENLEEKTEKGYKIFGGSLQNAHLEGADLRGVHLHMDITGAHFEGANLQEADLQRMGLLLEAEQLRQGRNWVLAFLPKEILEKLGLPPDHNQRLKEKNLSSYNFSGLDLRRAIFINMNLKRADFSGANLEKAWFGGANLERAYLINADLKGADLRDAKGLTQEQLAKAFKDKNTKLPDYLKKPQPEKPESK
jgi:uncharacterized protein YjbI with pentapeptide repeats